MPGPAAQRHRDLEPGGLKLRLSVAALARRDHLDEHHRRDRRHLHAGRRRHLSSDSVRVTITATNTYGTTSASAASVGPALSAAPSHTTAPSLASGLVRGVAATVAPGVWSPTGTLTYQWQHATNNGTTWQNLSGQTSATYTPAKTDEGALLRATVTATNAYGTETATTNAIGPVASFLPANTTAPAVTGSAVRASVLTATPGAWTGAGNTYAEQWERCNAAGQSCQPITGQTGATYTLTQADEGFTIAYQVTATNVDAVLVKASASTALVLASRPVNTTAPAVTGSAVRASVLTATPGAWTGAANKYTEQWERCNSVGSSCQAIAGATGLSYTLTQADESSPIAFAVAATNPDGFSTVASRMTAVVAGAPPVAVKLPSVSGTWSAPTS